MSFRKKPKPPRRLSLPIQPLLLRLSLRRLSHQYPSLSLLLRRHRPSQLSPWLLGLLMWEKFPQCQMKERQQLLRRRPL